MARIRVLPELRTWYHRHGTLLFLAREEGVLLSPQDQRRRVDLTKTGRNLIARKNSAIPWTYPSLTLIPFA